MTGSLPPWWPYGSFSIWPPAGMEMTWLPRQMPKTGSLPRQARTASTTGGTLTGSPGPLEKNTPSGFISRTFSAGVSHGTTVTSQPAAERRLAMPFFSPQS